MPSEPLLTCKGEGSSRVKKRKPYNFEAFLQRHVRQKKGRRKHYQFPGPSPLINVVNANEPPPKMTGGGKRKTVEEEDKGQAKKARRSRSLCLREFMKMTGGEKRKTSKEEDKGRAKKTRRSRAYHMHELERMWRELRAVQTA